MHEVDDVFTIHVEHIILHKQGGETDLSDLTYSCEQCNLRKGTNLLGIDPESAETVKLLHPRNDEWYDHLQPVGPRLIDTANATQGEKKVPSDATLRLTMLVQGNSGRLDYAFGT